MALFDTRISGNRSVSTLELFASVFETTFFGFSERYFFSLETEVLVGSGEHIFDDL